MSEIRTRSQENQHFNPITAVQSLVKSVQSTSPQFTKMYICTCILTMMVFYTVIATWLNSSQIFCIIV